MKSSTGQHFATLDHIRALAALLVFVWHFTHGDRGYPSPFEGSPGWGVLAVFDEGHVGVALFMTLSGYLFAKLLDGKPLNFTQFLLNRALRLLPLLAVVLLAWACIAAIRLGEARAVYWFVRELPAGFVRASWPHGTWSVAVEVHFYLLLPIFLALLKRSPWALLSVLVLSLGVRAAIFAATGDVKNAAYLTLLGRIDQFVLGIAAWHFRSNFASRHSLAVGVGLAIITFYTWFNGIGGLTDPAVSRSSIWVVLPLIEGASCAALIAWYDNSFRPAGFWSDTWAKAGEYSYAVYLLHFFVAFPAAAWIHENVVSLARFETAFVAALVGFAAMMPLAYLSMEFIEKPFLRLRKHYVGGRGMVPTAA